MRYLLNLVYLLLLVLAAPWLLWQAVRKGKYREGFAAKFLGACRGGAANGSACGCTRSASAR